MPAGRPSGYKPEYCKTVVELGRQGKSLAQIACALGVVRNTIRAWEEENPEFLTAMDECREQSLAHWEELGYKGAIGDLDVSAPLWSRSMTARFPKDYTERKQTELSGRDGQPIEHAMILRDLPEDELTARIEAAMKAMGNG